MIKPGETFLNQQKRSVSNQVSVSVTALGGQVVPLNPNRVSLVLLPHPTVLYCLSLVPGATAGQGITLPIAGAPVVLSLADHGQIVQGPWYYASANAPQTVTFIETQNSNP